MRVVNIFPGDKRVETFPYPAGELQVRLNSELIAEINAGAEVRVWTEWSDNDDLMHTALLVNAVKGLRPLRLTLILPYLPYARADRRFLPGDCFGLRVAADIINGMNCDRVVTLDAHSPVAEKLIQRLINVSPLRFITWASNIVEYMRADRELTIVLPDEGASRYNLTGLGHPIVQCKKERDSKTGKLLRFEVPSITTNAYLIVDDICDGGGTFLGIAEKVPVEKSAFLCVTHGIFSQGFRKLNTAFDRVFCTDSYQSLKKLEAAVHPARIFIEETLDEIDIKDLTK